MVKDVLDLAAIAREHGADLRKPVRLEMEGFDEHGNMRISGIEITSFLSDPDMRKDAHYKVRAYTKTFNNKTGEYLLDSVQDFSSAYVGSGSVILEEEDERKVVKSVETRDNFFFRPNWWNNF